MQSGLAAAHKALTGISIGDAFGESFFGATSRMKAAIAERQLPETSWQFTDDTIMAIPIYESLQRFDGVDQEYIVQRFLENYQHDPERGYGPSMHHFFRAVEEGANWKDIAAGKFEGMGSMGNGGAMRSALIGACFSNDMDRVASEAELACMVTHTNVEAVCGSIAVAKACAIVSRDNTFHRDRFFEEIIEGLPASDTRAKIGKAFAMDGQHRMDTMVSILGNGTRMLAQDTVPLALWCVARHPDNFKECLWELVSALGDRDTLCAIAGGIAVMSAAAETVPPTWQKEVEPWKDSIFYQVDKKQ